MISSPSPVEALLGETERCLDRGDRPGARRAAERALELAVAAGDDHLTLKSHNLLGIVGKHMGEFDLAAHHYAEAGRVIDEGPTEDPVARGAICHNLGGLAFSRGDLETAERETRRAVELHEPLFGSEHTNVCAHRGQLGSILSEQGRLDEAAELLEGAAAGFAAALGEDDVEVGIATTSLGLVHHRAGRLDLAADCYRRGLAIRERAVGPNHPELAFTLVNLASLERELGNAEAGMAHAERAVAVLEGQVADDHPAAVAARSLVEGTA